MRNAAQKLATFDRVVPNEDTADLAEGERMLRECVFGLPVRYLGSARILRH